MRDLMSARTVRGLAALLRDKGRILDSCPQQTQDDLASSLHSGCIKEAHPHKGVNVHLDGSSALPWMLSWFLQLLSAGLILSCLIMPLVLVHRLKCMLAAACGGEMRAELLAVAALPAILVVWPLCSLLILVILKTIVVGKMRPGRYQLWS